MFDLETERVVAWIRQRNYSSVVLQLPEGLKISAPDVSEALSRETGAEVLILGYPCYGACDLFIDFRKYGEALVHYGHSPIPSMGSDPDILFIEVSVASEGCEGLESAATNLPEKVGLLATVQYVPLIPDVRLFLEGMGKKVYVGKGDGRICYPGQVLGCNFSSATSVEAEVDAFLFLGEGDFHPLAAAFGSGKEIFVLNPISGELRTVDDIRDRILRRRFAAIEKARSAETFGIIICGKAGQCRKDVADRSSKMLASAGKKYFRVLVDEVTPDSLMPFRADVFVNTACPRVALDDTAKYGRPVLTPPELEIALGLREWDDYLFDSILG